ncbi:MAG: hypothetical protein JXB13_08340 [Phycisphaerae bacterium]|nr:hypothetical protein [Phycisphaerae bacterium]
MPDEHNTSNPPESPDPTLLETDLPCVSCGYNLRGLPPDGRCPECATPVAVSLQGDWLRFANRQWLQGIRWGVAALIAAHLCPLGLSLLFMFGPSLAALSSTTQIIMSSLMCLVYLVLQTVGTVGTFLITSRDPRTMGRPDRRVLAWAARTAAVVLLVSASLTVVTPARMSGLSAAALIVMYSVLSLACTLFYLGQLVYLRRLARRIPDATLSSWTLAFLLVSPALAVVHLLPALLLNAVAILGVTATLLMIGNRHVVQLLPGVYVVLLLCHRRALARVAKEASDIAQPTAEQNDTTAS